MKFGIPEFRNSGINSEFRIPNSNSEFGIPSGIPNSSKKLKMVIASFYRFSENYDTQSYVCFLIGISLAIIAKLIFFRSDAQSDDNPSAHGSKKSRLYVIVFITSVLVVGVYMTFGVPVTDNTPFISSTHFSKKGIPDTITHEKNGEPCPGVIFSFYVLDIIPN